MADKNFKVKNKLVIAGLTNANGVLLAENHSVDSHTNLATQYGGTGTTTSPTSGQVLYSTSGTTYAPTTLKTLDVKGSSYSDNSPANPVVGQIWVESDSSSDSFDPNIIRRKTFTATAAQTVFTTDLEFIQGYEQVFFNGMLLLRNSDYTTASNTNVTLASGAAAGDILEVVTVTNLNSVNTYTQGEIDTSLSAKLSTSTAASTYLTQANAATTYVAQSNYFVAGKNKVLNGDFKIWQRGTSFSTTASLLYTADRWWTNAFSGTATVSQQTFAPGTAPVAGYEGQYFLRFANTNTFTQLGQRIEDVRAFAGQTVSVSFWAKAASSLSLQPYLEQNFGSGGSGSTYAAGTAASVTTSWQRFTATIPAASISGKTIGTSSFLNFYFLTSTLNTNIDIWGVQLEAGSNATAFQTATGTIQGELAACQRYYYLHVSTLNDPIGFGSNYSTTAANTYVKFPVEMRVAPTLAASTGTSYYVFVRNGGSDFCNSLLVDIANKNGMIIYNGTEISGTAGDAGYFALSNASGSIAFGAEL